MKSGIQPKPTTQINDLPIELIDAFSSFMSQEELAKFATLSKGFQNVNKQRFWKNEYLRLFGKLTSPALEKDKSENPHLYNDSPINYEHSYFIRIQEIKKALDIPEHIPIRSNMRNYSKSKYAIRSNVFTDMISIVGGTQYEPNSVLTIHETLFCYQAGIKTAFNNESDLYSTEYSDDHWPIAKAFLLDIELKNDLALHKNFESIYFLSKSEASNSISASHYNFMRLFAEKSFSEFNFLHLNNRFRKIKLEEAIAHNPKDKFKTAKDEFDIVLETLLIGSMANLLEIKSQLTCQALIDLMSELTKEHSTSNNLKPWVIKLLQYAKKEALLSELDMSHKDSILNWAVQSQDIPAIKFIMKECNYWQDRRQDKLKKSHLSLFKKALPNPELTRILIQSGLFYKDQMALMLTKSRLSGYPFFHASLKVMLFTVLFLLIALPFIFALEYSFLYLGISFFPQITFGMAYLLLDLLFGPFINLLAWPQFRTLCSNSAIVIERILDLAITLPEYCLLFLKAPVAMTQMLYYHGLFSMNLMRPQTDFSDTQQEPIDNLEARANSKPNTAGVLNQFSNYKSKTNHASQTSSAIVDVKPQRNRPS